MAIAVARRYGTERLILLNHDINANVEDPDIKRFKKEVSAHIGVDVTQADHPHFATMDQFDICVKAKAFKVSHSKVICTSRLKTGPFMRWLVANVPDKNCVLYYGFDAGETARIQRRSGILGSAGYQSDYPLALWPEETQVKGALVKLRVGSTAELGIQPPLTYGIFKHANCVGCIKARRQHWYCVYCTRPDIWEKAKRSEETIGHSIISGVYLDELGPLFADMQTAGVEATEHVKSGTFWAAAKRKVKVLRAVRAAQPSTANETTVDVDEEDDARPCECVY